MTAPHPRADSPFDPTGREGDDEPGGLPLRLPAGIAVAAVVALVAVAAFWIVRAGPGALAAASKVLVAAGLTGIAVVGAVGLAWGLGGRGEGPGDDGGGGPGPLDGTPPLPPPATDGIDAELFRIIEEAGGSRPREGALPRARDDVDAEPCPPGRV